MAGARGSVIGSSDLMTEPLTRTHMAGARESQIASHDTGAAHELDEGHRRSMHEKGIKYR